MSMNKKGLSDVITNVLIILLVVIAIGVIAAFVFPLLRGTINEAGETQQCFGVDMAITNCVWSVAAAGNVTNITIERGSGDYQLSEVTLIYLKADGTTTSEKVNTSKVTSLKSEFATIIETQSLKFEPKSVGLAATLEGTSRSCPESPKVVCTKAS